MLQICHREKQLHLRGRLSHSIRELPLLRMNSTCMRLNLAVPPPAAIIREPISCIERPQAIGKFLFVGGEKFWVRGVTYGTFQPDALGHQFPSPDVVRRDFAAMARAGLNCVR